MPCRHAVCRRCAAGEFRGMLLLRHADFSLLLLPCHALRAADMRVSPPVTVAMPMLPPCLRHYSPCHAYACRFSPFCRLFFAAAVNTKSGMGRQQQKHHCIGSRAC